MFHQRDLIESPLLLEGVGALYSLIVLTSHCTEPRRVLLEVSSVLCVIRAGMAEDTYSQHRIAHSKSFHLIVKRQSVHAVYTATLPTLYHVQGYETLCNSRKV